ncbi:ABC transporter permease [Bacteroidota bacterium]
MFKNYLLIAFRNILRNKIFSLINIIGLATGIASFVLIALFVAYELSFESSHENAENIYWVNIAYDRGEQSFTTHWSPTPLAPALQEDLPEIKKAARIKRWGGLLFRRGEKVFYESGSAFVDPEYLEILTLPIVAGDKENPLSKHNSIVISEEIAQKYFGDENPIGQTINLGNETDLMITAVMKNLPDNTRFDKDMLISMSTFAQQRGDDFYTNRISTEIYSFVLLNPGVDVDAFREKCNNYFDKQYNAGLNHKSRIELEALTDLHLYSELRSDGGIGKIYIFSITGILLLLIASINFMNLSTAKAANRAKEIGIRKASGAARSQLIQQFLGESVIYSIISLAAATVMVYLLLPLFSELTGIEMTIVSLFNPEIMGIVLGATLLVGLISGSYPAFFLAAFNPAKVLKGEVKRGSGGSAFRTTLVVIQFTISTALITGSLIIGDQLDYMQNKELGFEKDQVLTVRLKGNEFRDKSKLFVDRLAGNSNILSVSRCDMLPGDIIAYNTVSKKGASKDDSFIIKFNRIDENYFNTFKLELIAGRNFSPEFPADYENGLIINETAAAMLGGNDIVGNTITQWFGNEGREMRVVGIVKDFHFSSFKNKIEPLELMYRDTFWGYAAIKLNTQDVRATIDFIETVHAQVNPGYPMEYYFMDEFFEERYTSEENMRTIFGYFSILTIIVSCLGLLGLASYLASQKTKEIGIRKVLGASEGNIVMILSRQFMKWVLIANVIAVPAAYLFMSGWLEDFAYRTGIGINNFVMAALIAFVTAFFTVGFQALKAARINPADSLRNE